MNRLRPPLCNIALRRFVHTSPITNLLRKVLKGKSELDVANGMQSFLEKSRLKPEEVEFVMAAYAVNDDNVADLKRAYPGVETFLVNGTNRLVGKDFIPLHYHQFAVHYRPIITTVPDAVKEPFYANFLLRWETEDESSMFNSHKTYEEVLTEQPRLEQRERSISRNEKNMFTKLAKQRANYVLMVGAGISAQLVHTDTEDHTDRVKDPAFITVSSWPGLVSLAHERILEFVNEPLRGYFQRAFTTAPKDLMDQACMLYRMVKVYNLYNGTGFEYTGFVAKLFGSVVPAKPTPAVALALGSRNVPIATTNYDTLLEDCLNRFEYNLPEQLRAEKVRKEGGKIISLVNQHRIVPSNYQHHIYHLHGLWHSKAELTLGVEYAASDRNFQRSMAALTKETDHGIPPCLRMTEIGEESLDDALATTFASSFFTKYNVTKPIVFVGTGTGVFDAHFLPWLRASSQKHYILVRNKDFENISDTIENIGLRNKLIPVVYGTHHKELAAFIEKLPVRDISQF